MTQALSETVSFERRDDIALILVNNAPVNALSHSVRAGLMAAIDALNADDSLVAGVISAEGRTFMAGADIREFGKPMQAPGLPTVVDHIEASNKPVVAAIFGTALGGGLEVALGCHARLALAGSKVGLPEVHLGLLPGAGGTQRLPRLAGVDFAVDAILSGNHIPADHAKLVGVVDDVVDGDLIAAAITHARLIAEQPPRRTGDIEIDASAFDAGYFDAQRATVARKRRGFFAPGNCISAVEAAVNLPITEGLARERALFEECAQNPQAAAQQHAFFAERQINRVPGIDKTTPTRDVTSVAVIGGGTMGRGIAIAFLEAGFHVTLSEINDDALASVTGLIAAHLDRQATKGRITPDQAADTKARFAGVVGLDGLNQADLIIEAIFEDMAIKEDLFEKLGGIAKPGAIIASNTSYLDVDRLADVSGRPSDVLGLHFFSPANIMKLLEIVNGAQTAPDVLATALKIAKQIKKLGVVAGVCHGFIGNRMISRYSQQAARLVAEGAAPEAVDKVLFEFGMPMGPFVMGDMAGLDIGYLNRKGMEPGSFDATAFLWMDRLVEAGRKGQKTGAGVYRYEDGNRTPMPDTAIIDIIETARRDSQITPRDISADEILERTTLALINEGSRLLHEGIALRASDIDVVYLSGYGFPRFRGGPMFYADSLGLAHVRDRINHWRSTDPANWGPNPLLDQLVEAGLTFKDYDAGKRP